MPNKQPNKNKIRRQPTPDSPPPARQGERDAPGDKTDGLAVGHEEAEAQRRHGNVVPATSGNAPSRPRPTPAHTN